MYAIDPKSAMGVKFRESIVLGDCTLSKNEIEKIIAQLSEQFLGKSYNIFTKYAQNSSNS